MFSDAGGGVIRLFRATDPAGLSAVSEYVRPIQPQGVRSVTETVMDFLRPLSPRETELRGVFWYTDPAVGSGWLRMEGFMTSTVDEVHQAVRTLELSAAIRQSEPVRQEVLSVGNAVVNRTTNPYFKIVAGVVVLLVASFGALRLVTTPGMDPGKIVASITLFLVAALSLVLIVNGFKRRSWWHRARAEARRRGLELPDQLRVWN